MKQLTIRPTASVASTPSIIARMIHFASRKTNVFVTLPHRLVGKWRLYLNYCPECNSIGHKSHHCDVCQGDTKAYFAWSKEVEQTWWQRYAAKHRLVA